MNRKRLLAVALFTIVVLALSECGTRFSEPPADVRESDLIGIWETQYWRLGRDTLVLRADGLFKQLFQSNSAEDYIFETAWSEWWLEHLPDGNHRLHLQDARYYLVGEHFAEREGFHAACPEEWPSCRGGSKPLPHRFFDPYRSESVEMTKELVLNIRSESTGEIILHHLWPGRDRGFALFGGEGEVFRRTQGND